jgi:hypothetical protein
MRSLALLVATAVLAAAPPAQAGPSVTLNGVSINGVANQKFENVTVVIDAQGNLDIQAKGYAVRTAAAAGALATAAAAPPAAPPPPAAPGGVPLAPSHAPAPGPAVGPSTVATAMSGQPGRLTRRYFLATEQSQPDGTQYDVEVFINASWIRVVKSADPQVVTEITRYLRPGPNKVTLSCTKRLQGVERRNYAADVTLRVVVGAGNVGGDHVMIDDPLAVMTRTAAEVDDKVEEFVFEAR